LVLDLGRVGRAAGRGGERRVAVAGDARSHSRASVLDLGDLRPQFFGRFFVAESPYTWTHRTFGSEWTGPYLAKEEQASGDSSVPTPLARALDVLFPALRFLVVIGTIIVAPFAWRSRWKMSLVFCVTLVVYNQAAVALAATIESRYTFYIVPPLLAAVTMGLQAYSERRAAKPLQA
jgi:hypothetical protein